MIRMIKSGLYKLFKDKTFKVTLIIGAALAVFMNLLYVAIGALADDIAGFCLCNRNCRHDIFLHVVRMFLRYTNSLLRCLAIT